MTIKKIILRLAKLKAGMEVLNKKAAKQEFDRTYKVAAAIESAETEDEKEAAAIFAAKAEAIRAEVEEKGVKATTAIAVAIDAAAEAAAAEVPDDEAVTATSELAEVLFEAVKGNEKPEQLKALFGQKKANEMIRNILSDKYDILDLEEAIINYHEL